MVWAILNLSDDIIGVQTLNMSCNGNRYVAEVEVIVKKDMAIYYSEPLKVKLKETLMNLDQLEIVFISIIYEKSAEQIRLLENGLHSIALEYTTEEENHANQDRQNSDQGQNNQCSQDPNIYINGLEYEEKHNALVTEF